MVERLKWWIVARLGGEYRLRAIKWRILGLFGVRREPVRRLTDAEAAEIEDRRRHRELYRRRGAA